MNFSKKRVQAVKDRYPIGTRIELQTLCNIERGMPSGLRGTVIGVDDLPSLLMQWDNGRTLSLLPGEDSYRVLTSYEVTAEQAANQSEEAIVMKME